MSLPPIQEECAVPDCPKSGTQWYELQIDDIGLGNKRVPLCDGHFEEVTTDERIAALFKELGGN